MIVVQTVINRGSRTRPTKQEKKETSPSLSGSPLGFWNLNLELQALKTILTPGCEWAEKLYAGCKPDHFHHNTTRAIFVRLQEQMDASKGYELPSLDFMLSDAKLAPSIRQTLRDAFENDLEDPLAIVKTQGDFDLLTQELSSLAKTRAVFKATQKAANTLLDSQEPTGLVEEVSTALGESLFNADDDEDFLTQIVMGKGYSQTAEDSYYRIISGVFEGAKIKTGFKTFDEKTGGFHRTNLVVIAASSGGGKSLFAVNLLVRQFLLGYSVILVSYEMTEDEVMIRLIANIAEVDMNRLQNKQLTPEEMDRCAAAWREFNLRGYELGSSYHIICPKKETTVSEVGFRIRGIKADVCILDYINLLASSTEGDQWQRLGDIARESKILANKLNCVMILLAQLDDAYNLRYSKAIKDHANFLMGWVRDENAIANRVISIRQLKARNAPLYPFELGERFDIAQFRDMDQDDRTFWPSKDDLRELELRCSQVGLMLEPTVSKETNPKKSKKKVEKKAKEEPKPEVITPIFKRSLDDIPEDSLLVTERSEDSPIDFSKIRVKSSDVSFLKSNSAFEGTV